MNKTSARKSKLKRFLIKLPSQMQIRRTPVCLMLASLPHQLLDLTHAPRRVFCVIALSGG